MTTETGMSSYFLSRVKAVWFNLRYRNKDNRNKKARNIKKRVVPPILGKNVNQYTLNQYSVNRNTVEHKTLKSEKIGSSMERGEGEGVERQRKEEKARKNTEKSGKNKDTEIKNRGKKTNKSKESTGSQQSLPDQPRQFPALMTGNSSMRSGKTLPAGSILDDMLSKLAVQVQLNSSRQEDEALDELASE